YQLKLSMGKAGRVQRGVSAKDCMIHNYAAVKGDLQLTQLPIIKSISPHACLKERKMSKLLDFLSRYEDGDEWLDYDAENDEVCCVVCENSWELEDEYAIKVHLNSLFHKMRVTSTESALNLSHIRNKKKIPPGLRDATSASAGGYLENEPVWQDYVNDPRVPCIYGFDCYRMNFDHHEAYKHPPHRKPSLPKPANNGWMVPIFVPKNTTNSANNIRPDTDTTQNVHVKQKMQLSDGLVTELTNGWVKVKSLRKTGNSAGTYEMYYYSPEGKKFRSLAHIQRWSQEMGVAIDLKAFMTENSGGQSSEVVECYDLSSDSNSSNSEMSQPQGNTHMNSEDVEIIDLDSNSSDAVPNIDIYKKNRNMRLTSPF
ncbi:unnamed protein product, partial [Meganyctiphanes norvegica]